MKRSRHHPLGVPGYSGAGTLSDDESSSRSSSQSITGLDRWLLDRVAKVCGHPPVAMVLWDGESGYHPDGAGNRRIEFRDRGALWAAVRSPELGFGDMYSAGRIEIDGDLIDVLYRCFRATDRSDPVRIKRDILGRKPKPAVNTRAGSRKHIHHHYDLGNDFYRLWLDEEMVYTCAYYPSRTASLEEAQRAKMHHVARKVGLAPGMSVVEAGCGWGSLALHMARHYGVRVRAFNISTEQVAYARERARAEGLDDRVEFVEDDYRNVSGTYDAFVSVGMLEHVGLSHYRELGAVVQRSLAAHGRGLIHSVGRSQPSPPNAWLEQRIFPGSYPPSLSEMMEIFEPYGFSVIDVENLRMHYARTLQEWLERFDRQLDRVLELYDTEFVRAWRLYLGGCAAAFMASSTQLYQVAFAHPDNNALPLTRGYLYDDGAKPEVWR